jgi:cation diffusion facilitator CzcD-associated flavoprotein CzcO/NAD(P)-dependent dehydrogenase (short-subunit alcohol dehydrogenase family)
MKQDRDGRPSGGIAHLDVLIVGAGLSGIDAGYRLHTGSPGKSFAIFEARGAIGGTWDLFRYPGIRSDSDMTTLGFPFKPWRGDRAIVAGGEIRDYIRETARVHGLDSHIHLGRRVVAADWSSAEARWTVEYDVEGRRERLSCSFLFLCSGYYNYAEGHAPTWPGMAAFGGPVVHPQFWPDDLDVTGKRVVVIGSGATAVTLAPALAAAGAAHVTMLQRSPTYIVTVPGEDRVAIALRRRLPAWLADPLVRWKNIAFSIYIYNFARRKPAKMKQMIATGQGRFLGPDFDMAHLTPRYDPWDQRLCLVPDGDLFKAIKSGAASIVTDTIARFTPDGLELGSGVTLPADVVVTATGLKLQMNGGATLSVDGAPVEIGSRMLYKGAMLEGVPNFAFAVGYTNASWTLKCDLTSRFVSKLINHMGRRGYAVVTPIAAPGTLGAEPMIGLKSSYIERAAAALPRQGLKAPWRVHQNYARDLFAFRTARMSDGVLRFEKSVGKMERAGPDMNMRFDLNGKVAVVTGAASGIGRAVSQALAARGCHLALCDIDEAGLEDTARLVGNAVRVTRHHLDVSDGEAIAALPDAIEAAHGGVDVLVNNAGVALGGTFDVVSESEFDWLVAINFQGVVRMTRAFLPLLKARPAAQLVNVSSLFGLVAPPGQTAYSASKFAVRGFSVALSNELLAAKSSVRVTVVHPGGVKTAIAANARVADGVPGNVREKQRQRFDKALKMPPERAAAIIVEGIEKRLPRVLVGSDAKIASLLERLMPVSYWRLLGRAI